MTNFTFFFSIKEQFKVKIITNIFENFCKTELNSIQRSYTNIY